MKRMLAFVLCLAMLLSMTAMAAAAEPMEAEEGLQAPLGRTGTTERYAPIMPKLAPQTAAETLDDPLADAIYTASFNKNEVWIYAYAGADAECVPFKGAMGTEITVSATVSPLWYALSRRVSEEIEYGYVRAEDLRFTETRRPEAMAYYTDEATGITVHLPEVTELRELKVAPVVAERAPMRTSSNLGERTLLASYKVGAAGRNGTSLTGATEICFTLPELPEIGEYGCYYAECLDAQGNVEELTVYPYIWSNVLYVDAPLDREIFVYAVDYPENEGLYAFSSDAEVYLSEEFEHFNTGRSFSEVTGVTVSNPDAVRVTPIYNEAGEIVDWELFAIKPFYGKERISFTYRESRADVGSGSSYTWAPGSALSGTYYITATLVSVQENCSVAADKTATIRVGTSGTNTKLRLAKRLTIKGTLNLKVDANCDASSIYRWNSDTYKDVNVPMLYVNGGKLYCHGVHSSYEPTTKYSLKLSGNNIATSRALIHVNAGGSVKVFNTEIYDAKNTAEDSAVTYDNYGGAFYINHADSYINLADQAKIYNCQAKWGGGIFVGAGHLNLTKSVSGSNESSDADAYIYSCKATSHGGGVYLDGGGYIDPNAGTSLYVGKDGAPNTANYGGGVYVGGGGTATINGAGELWVRYNEAANNGGGIQIEDTTLNVSSTVGIWVGYNKAKAGYGGGIVVNNYNGTAALNDTSTGTFSIYSNTAATNGGGIHTDATINTNGMSISANTAGSWGGGVRIENGSFNITAGVTIKENKASWGGGICITGGAMKWSGDGYWSVYSNTATSKGGGLYAYGGTITCESGNQLNLYTNTANYGGGMYLGGSTDTATDTSKKTVTFNGSGAGGLDIYSNTASINGGGAMVENCTVHFSAPVWMSHNTTSGSGGGMFIGPWVSACVININKNMNLHGNTATVDGGGIYASGSAITVASGATLNVSKADHNSLGEKDNRAVRGGGIFLTSGTLVNNGTLKVQGNTADDGGGLYLAGGVFETSGGVSVSGNCAHEGGGIFLNGGTILTTGESRPLIQGNMGKDGAICHHGGGIHAETGTIRINSSEDLCIYENKGQYGAGIFFGQTGGTVTIDGEGAGKLWPHENHDTEGDGAGIWIEACTVELKHKALVSRQVYGGTGTDDNGNSEGAIRMQKYNELPGILHIYGELIIENCVGNTWAGGITMATESQLYVKSGGILTITGCSTSGNGAAIQNDGGNFINEGTLNLTGNTAGGNGGALYLSGGSFVSATAVSVENNKAENGGAIYASDGAAVALAEGTALCNNTAVGNGGGLYAADAAVTMQGAYTISGNTATNGGGIYTNGDVDLTRAVLSGNVAENGGGLYLTGGTVTVGEGAEVQNNTASIGGGIYLAENSTLTMVGFETAPLRNNVASAAANDLYAVGGTTKVTITATMDPEGLEEYWFADYAAGDSAYPGQPVFPATEDHPGRFVYDETPVEYARRSFGGDSEEAGAAEASTAYLALALSKYEPKGPYLNEEFKIYHTLNLASGISLTYAVPKSQLAGYDLETVYMECVMEIFEGNTATGTETFRLLPTPVGSYYYFTLNDLTALQMNDRIAAVLHGMKEEISYYSVTDDFSVADYAYAQLNNAVADATLKTLCADLLRYGAAAQTYKGYRTDALADSAMTEEHRSYLSDLNAVTFGYANATLQDLANPTVTWAGKTLILDSKIAIKYVVDLSALVGDIKELNLRISYVDLEGNVKTAVVTELEVYNAARNWYSFTFDGLLAAELRSVVSAQVFVGDTPVSVTMQYSADTYGNGRTGTLGELCKAIFAYSDSAKAYFQK